MELIKLSSSFCMVVIMPQTFPRRIRSPSERSYSTRKDKLISTGMSFGQVMIKRLNRKILDVDLLNSLTCKTFKFNFELN